jgi:hypothetical protein
MVSGGLSDVVHDYYLPVAWSADGSSEDVLVAHALS